MMFFKIYKKYIYTAFSIFIILPFVLCFGLNGDEAFTMGIINLSYSGIIHATSLDIHPPLYYFLLKLFLSVTTFWTNNIFIKIIFARILSTIISIITFLYLLKILRNLSISYNKYLYLIIYLLLPLQLGFEQQFTNIRMYSLSILLFVIEIYYFSKYTKDNKNSSFIFIIIATAMSLYTNYMGGLVNGILLILVFIDTLLKKDFTYSKKTFLSGLIAIILFIPWIPNLLKQLSLTKYDTVMTMRSLIIFLVIITGICIVFLFPILLNIKKNIMPLYNLKKMRLYLYSTLSISLFAILITKPNAISLRYVAPVITPIMFIDSFYYIHYKQLYSNKKLQSFLIAIFSLFLLSNFSISLKNQIKNLDLPAYHFLKSFKEVSDSKQKSISAKDYGLTNYPWNHMGGNAIYLQSINKRINDKNYVNMYDSLGNGNKKLFKMVYYNIDHPYRKHF